MEHEYRVGEVTVTKVVEFMLPGFSPHRLLPGLAPDALQAHPEWVSLETIDPPTGDALLSVHSWLIKTPRHTILVDTGAGNDKNRPTMPVLDRLHHHYLERLAGAGVAPADVDYVLLTHIHADHVGWNTRPGDDGWVPTFSNAAYVFSEMEARYGAALSSSDEQAVQACLSQAGMGEPIRRPVGGVFEDSMKPVIGGGQARAITVDGSEVLEGIRFLPTAGHSIDHAAISLESSGQRAVFGGDVMHHPLEIHDPSLVSMFCEFPDAVQRARLGLLDELAETGALYFSSHFPSTSAGRVTRKGTGFHWAFE